ncbi:MAG: cysteine hydrolase [Planctomycetes bacterium]|nr:cysteine hydrolase [Planctomycetota bacterium]
MEILGTSAKTWNEIHAVGDPLRLQVLEFKVIPRSTALVIIDMQKYGCRHDMALGKLLTKTDPEAAKYWFSRLKDIVIPNIQELVSFFRNNRLNVCFACFGPLTPDGHDLKPSRCITPHRKWAQAAGSDHLWYPGTVEHEVIDELKPENGEILFNKNTGSAFTSTNIDHILRNMEIESLVITGVATDSCVETTARDASDRGYNCILVEDGCCARAQERHDMTMKTFASIFGRVMYTSEVIDCLRL